MWVGGRHVLEVHRAATQRNEVAEDEEREEAFFKRYLEYCRAKVAPRLSQAAADSLVSQYVELREQARPSPPGCASNSPLEPPHLPQQRTVWLLWADLRKGFQTISTESFQQGRQHWKARLKCCTINMHGVCWGSL